MKHFLLYLGLLSCAPLSAQLAELSHAPLQAEPVQMFIRLLGDTRSATAPAGVAKAQALRLFNRLYANSSHEMQELLGTFVTNLQRILDHRLMLPRTKERQVIMLLEETKHLLMEVSGHTLGHNNKELCEDVMHQLYIALNPTFGDHWRRWRRIGGGIIGGTLGLLLLIACWKLYRGINQEGQWGQTLRSIKTLIDYSLKPPVAGQAYLSTEIAKTLQLLQNKVNLQNAASLQQLMQNGTHIEQLAATFNYLMLTDAQARAQGDNSASLGERWAAILEHAMSNKDSALTRFLPQLGALFTMLARESEEEATEKASMSPADWAQRERTANQHWATVAHALVTGDSAVTASQLVDAFSNGLRALTGQPAASQA